MHCGSALSRSNPLRTERSALSRQETYLNGDKHTQMIADLPGALLHTPVFFCLANASARLLHISVVYKKSGRRPDFCIVKCLIPLVAPAAQRASARRRITCPPDRFAPTSPYLQTRLARTKIFCRAGEREQTMKPFSAGKSVRLRPPAAQGTSPLGIPSSLTRGWVCARAERRAQPAIRGGRAR